MIPSTVGFLDQDFEIETQPSLTYKMDLDGDSVRGLVDEQDAMKQMIFRTLQTERYQYIIYPWYAVVPYYFLVWYNSEQEVRRMEVGRILPTEAAVILNVSPQFIRIAMQQGKLPIGTAVQMSSIWTYHISEKLLADYSGKDIQAELERIRGKRGA